MYVNFYSIIRINNKPIGVWASFNGEEVFGIKTNLSILDRSPKSFVFNDLDSKNQSILLENAQYRWNEYLEQDNYYCEESEYYEELEQGYSQDR